MVTQVNRHFQVSLDSLLTFLLGEISAWYRGKSNIAASKSNFQELGLKMFVFTNADNC